MPETFGNCDPKVITPLPWINMLKKAVSHAKALHCFSVSQNYVPSHTMLEQDVNFVAEYTQSFETMFSTSLAIFFKCNAGQARPGQARPDQTSDQAVIQCYLSICSLIFSLAKNSLSLRISLTAPLNSRLYLWISRCFSLNSFVPPLVFFPSKLHRHTYKSCAKKPGWYQQIGMTRYVGFTFSDSR